jgi:hypothetical protein
MKHQAGHTLAEILCITFILVIIGSVITLFITSSWRRIQLTNMVEDMNRSALLSLDHLARDISETTSSRVIIDGTNNFICFPTARDIDGTYRLLPGGEPDWNGWILYYLFPDGSLRTTDNRQIYLLARKRLAGTITNPPAASAAGDLSGATIVARNMLEFTIVMDNLLGTVNYRATVKVTKEYGGRDCYFELERVFAAKSP